MALVLLLVSRVIPGVVVAGVGTAILASLVLGVLNSLVRPILVLLTLPVTVVTLGLFLFVVNAAVFALTAGLVPGFAVYGLWSALLGAALTSLFGLILNRIL